MVSTLQMAMALPNCVTGNTENEELGMPTEDACGGMWREFGFGLFLILLSINLCFIFYIHVEMLQLENPIHQLHLIRQHA
ncbi:uncharacterized protein LOC120354476 isoform X3 [Nilaparvata lugens]|uniref:uncharacterized protein LOC120354476 isoform X3 n=1 Tax=Nilaparvata lugens TaxID=108931 RepID=UPI00193DE17C|nr:uncharacterized protein LOC120354476 isoform X3 [Nilaparvata lugens]